MSDVGLDFTPIMFPLIILFFIMIGAIIILAIKEIKETITEIKAYLEKRKRKIS